MFKDVADLYAFVAAELNLPRDLPEGTQIAVISAVNSVLSIDGEELKSLLSDLVDKAQSDGNIAKLLKYFVGAVILAGLYASDRRRTLKNAPLVKAQRTKIEDLLGEIATKEASIQMLLDYIRLLPSQ